MPATIEPPRSRARFLAFESSTSPIGGSIGRAPGMSFGGVLALPIVPVALVGAYLHFVYEERFNQNLLFDLVARPAPTMKQVPHLAA